MVTKRDLPADGLPDFAKSMVGGTLSVTETYEWGAAAGDGSRTGTLTVEVAGAPVALRSAVRLAPTAGGSQITVDGDLKASIPLFGGKVEKAAAPAVIEAMRSEQRTGTAWLAERDLTPSRGHPHPTRRWARLRRETGPAAYALGAGQPMCG